jgi:hypothetical protein
MKTTSCCRTTPGHPRASGAKRVFRQVFWLVPVFFPSRPALIFWFLLKSHRLNLYMKDKQPKQLFSQKLSAGQWIPKKHSRNSQRRDRPGFAPVFPFKARRPPEVTKADKSSRPRTFKKPAMDRAPGKVLWTKQLPSAKNFSYVITAASQWQQKLLTEILIH